MLSTPAEPGLRRYCARCPVVEGGCPGGTATVGGAVLGAMPVVAGGFAASRAVRGFSPPAKVSSRMITMNTAPAKHPHREGVPILGAHSDLILSYIIRP